MRTISLVLRSFWWSTSSLGGHKKLFGLGIGLLGGGRKARAKNLLPEASLFSLLPHSYCFSSIHLSLEGRLGVLVVFLVAAVDAVIGVAAVALLAVPPVGQPHTQLFCSLIPFSPTHVNVCVFGKALKAAGKPETIKQKQREKGHDF